MPILGVEVKVDSALPSNWVQRFVVFRIARLGDACSVTNSARETGHPRHDFASFCL